MEYAFKSRIKTLEDVFRVFFPHFIYPKLEKSHELLPNDSKKIVNALGLQNLALMKHHLQGPLEKTKKELQVLEERYLRGTVSVSGLSGNPCQSYGPFSRYYVSNSMADFLVSVGRHEVEMRKVVVRETEAALLFLEKEISRDISNSQAILPSLRYTKVFDDDEISDVLAPSAWQQGTEAFVLTGNVAEGYQWLPCQVSKEVHPSPRQIFIVLNDRSKNFHHGIDHTTPIVWKRNEFERVRNLSLESSDLLFHLIFQAQDVMR